MHTREPARTVRAGLIALALAGAVVAQDSRSTDYRPYVRHDLSKAMTINDGAAGKKTVSIDLRVVAAAVDDLSRHARDYPPKFREQEERVDAEQDAKSLSQLFDLLTGPEGDEVGVHVLLLAARLESIGHNLEIKGAAARAVRHFERLLAREPDHAEANLRYGGFLAGTATRQKDSIPYLEKALRLGEEGARFTLGMAHLMLRDQDRALEHLEEYAKRHPGHTTTLELIAAIKSGRIERLESRPGRKSGGGGSKPAGRPPARSGERGGR
jgi:tetratricopeptide (TPR) repeat protein